MKITGGCHCGKITYEGEINLENVVICHCTDCQSLSGSAFRTVAMTERGAFKFLTGEPKTYVKTGDSGKKREQTFCGDCGSPIYSTSVGEGSKTIWS
ncbi:glutathione-dependent formaldehyde-activating enzyme [Yoonia maricola]|uniref:Glutathione-dependent formaldehyde-activating enzyme n=1 Tax=Yoonia maricola TaxID=420999 RepID=A0A2M8WMR3_9RHOB|nr:glutathione-dependent formaldehyde-activating enzyme [Yoonia maricola]